LIPNDPLIERGLPADLSTGSQDFLFREPYARPMRQLFAFRAPVLSSRFAGCIVSFSVADSGAARGSDSPESRSREPPRNDTSVFH
jgi:hypothetical protein